MNNRSTELHPVLQTPPSLASRTTAAIQKLADTANVCVDLIERLKTYHPALRPADPNVPTPHALDAHLKAIERGDFREAARLLALYGMKRT